MSHVPIKSTQLSKLFDEINLKSCNFKIDMESIRVSKNLRPIIGWPLAKNSLDLHK